MSKRSARKRRVKRTVSIGVEYPPAWTESDFRRFADFGSCFVPDRDLQIQTLCDLISEESANVIEVCCGQGFLAEPPTRRLVSTRWMVRH